MVLYGYLKINCLQLGIYPYIMAMDFDVFERLELEQLRRRRSYKWARYPAPVIPAWVAEMDYPVAEPITEALADLVRRGDWGYPPHREYCELGQTVAVWARDELHWPVEPDAVFALADALKAMELVLASQLPPGSGVLITPPVYYPFFSIPRNTGHVTIEVPLRHAAGEWSLDLDRLEHAMRGGAGVAPVRALLLCHPHNPTGTVFPDADLHALADLCDRYGILVVSDEVHALLELDEPRRWRPYSLYHRDPETVYTATSTAKAWNTAGLKAGLLVAHGTRARGGIEALPHRVKSGISLPGLVALQASLQHGRPWLEACRRQLAARRAQVKQAVESWPFACSFTPARAGYLAWIGMPEVRRRLPGGETLREFFLREAQVALSDGSEFGAAYGDWVRLNFATSSGVLGTMTKRMGGTLGRIAR